MSLVRVDRLIRTQHALLEANDECYFFGEYTARKGFAYSETNQLILNFKKGLDRRGFPEYVWKARAIRQVARLFRDALAETPQQQQAMRAYTLIPMPPSRSREDDLYDDRLRRMLDTFGAGFEFDIRELLTTARSMRPSHGSENRPSVDEICSNLRIDRRIASPSPTSIVLFDDMLVSGAHFKAAQRKLHEEYPAIPITGMFIARRAIDVEAL